MAEKNEFDEELVTKFPRSNKKVKIEVRPYGINAEIETDQKNKSQSLHISPYGLEFQVPSEYPEGTLLKIDVTIPNYWFRKQQFVNYSRIDSPNNFKLLAKVVRSEDIGKRGKKKKVLVQTVNIDSVDEEVLRNYLEEGK